MKAHLNYMLLDILFGKNNNQESSLKMTVNTENISHNA